MLKVNRLMLTFDKDGWLFSNPLENKVHDIGILELMIYCIWHMKKIAGAKECGKMSNGV